MKRGRLALCLGVGLIACGQGDIKLSGDMAENFRKLTGHKAVTLSEKTTIYGTAEPPSECLVKHEEAHKAQAKVIADALVAIGAIDDDELSRMGAWVAVYTIDYVNYGYSNRFEKEARLACKK